MDTKLVGRMGMHVKNAHLKYVDWAKTGSDITTTTPGRAVRCTSRLNSEA